MSILVTFGPGHHASAAFTYLLSGVGCLLQARRYDSTLLGGEHRFSLRGTGLDASASGQIEIGFI